MEMKLNIGSDIENLRIVESKVDEVMSKLRISRDEYGRILVATMEAVNNAIIHGNNADVKKSVNVCFEYDQLAFTVKVRDQGMGFNPACVPDPTSPENIENIDGRGIFLMKSLSDDIDYNDDGNEVVMKFKIVTGDDEVLL